MEIKSGKTCNVSIENRSKLAVTGVLDVISFDEESVIVDTELGALVIRGQNFHINKLNVDIGEITVDGDIDHVAYEDNFSKQKSESFFAKLFK